MGTTLQGDFNKAQKNTAPVVVNGGRQGFGLSLADGFVAANLNICLEHVAVTVA